MTSGAVRDGTSIFFPVSQVEFPTPLPYEASIYGTGGDGSWREVGGQPLNTGLGSAQTSLYPVGDRVWAIWIENDFEHAEFGGMIKTGVFAARISLSGRTYDRKVTLWTGETVFPEIPQVIDFRGRPMFLYFRQQSRYGGMHATVELGIPRP